MASGCCDMGNSQGTKSVFACTQRAAALRELFAFLWQNWQKAVMGSVERFLSGRPCRPRAPPRRRPLQKFVFAAGGKILFVIYCQLRLGKSFPATAANQSGRKFICAPIKSPLFFALCAGARATFLTRYNQSSLGRRHRRAHWSLILLEKICTSLKIIEPLWSQQA